MKFLFLITFLMVTSVFSSHAVASDDRPAGVEIFGALGSGVLFEKGNDSITEVTRLPLSAAAGVAMAPWRARIEYSTFRTADGNTTVSVARDTESVMSWLGYDFVIDSPWTPTAAVGVGVLRTTVETTLNQAMEKTRGSWRGGFSLAAGFQARWTSRLTVRPELRFDSAEDFKIKDARWGVFLNAEFSIF